MTTITVTVRLLVQGCNDIYVRVLRFRADARRFGDRSGQHWRDAALRRRMTKTKRRRRRQRVLYRVLGRVELAFLCLLRLGRIRASMRRFRGR